MSEVKKLRPINKAELAAKGVVALGDRPNMRQQYGVGGLTAAELKKWFDGLSVFLADKINELQNTLAAPDASDYIKIDTDDANIATLGDLVRAIYSGYLSERALNVTVPGLASGTLRYVLTRLNQEISLNSENIDTLMENAGIRISSVTSGNTVTVRLTNSTGKVLAFITLDLTATTDRIADGAVTMPKIAEKSLSTDAFADQSVSTRTIQPKAVTEDKLSPELLLKLASLAGGALSGVSFDPATNRITVTNAAGQSFSAEIVFDSSSIDADPKGTAKQAVSAHNADTSAHADLRKIVSELAQRLSAIADSDDGTLDQLSEIVAYIKNNKNLIENITTSKVSYADIVSDLVTGGEKKALSAAQGVAIKALIDGLDRNKASHAELASELERLLREAKESGEFDGESISIVSTQESSGSGGINVVTFSDGSKLNVKNGYTPYIGENGNWYIGNVDTTIKAKGEKGDKGDTGIGISSVAQTTTSTADGGSNIITVTKTDGTKSTFTVKNGSKGSKGDPGDDYVLTDADKTEIASIVRFGSIPDYWHTHLDERVEDIRRAMESAGRNKSAFFFYSDAHWSNETTYTAKLAPALLKYLHAKTPINKTNYGGDIVSAESSDTDTMAYLWDWREQLRDLPNHHSVIGNHDDGNTTNNLFSTEYIYAYLFAPEENNDIVWGGDFYYYIDDKSEKTRYLYLDIFYDGVSSAQLEFAKEAIRSVPEGWHIVAVCHAWFANDYSVYPPLLNGFATETQPFLDMFDDYNARSGEYASCGGNVELCIGGHYHLDHYEHTAGGIPVIIVEADTIHNRSGTMPSRGTTDEAAVSAVVCDYNERVVKVIRVGRGESYEVPINWTAPVRYTNVIPLSVASDGTPFADGKGWMANSRIGSGGIYAGNQTPGTDAAQWVTGHIAIDPNIDNTIRLKNITFDKTSTNGNHGVFFFDASFANAKPSSSGNATYLTVGTLVANGYAKTEFDGNNIVKFDLKVGTVISNTNIRYFAICCGGLSDDSIITINEPIE